MRTLPRPSSGRHLRYALPLALLLATSCATWDAENDGDSDQQSGSPATTSPPAEGTDADPGQQEDNQETTEDTPEESGDVEFTIVSTGDVLPHDNVIDAAAELAGDPEGSQGYEFRPLLAEVEEWVSGADLALCSMEVPLTPPGVEPEGYPTFGAPEELVPALSETGFHGCNTANNHSMDRDIAGLEHTMEMFEDQGMGHVGTARSEQEAQAAQFYTLERADREITVAHLSTTMLHNHAYPIPDDESWRVTDLSAEELTEAAAEARQQGADVVVASVHWGTEYVDEPTAQQREYGEQLAAGGEIDAVYGNHSHTPQPIEELEGGPAGEGMWVVWSMGNFLHNQDEHCCVPEAATGTLVYAQVEAPEGEEPRVTGMDWSPVTVDRENQSRDDEEFYGIWPLSPLREEIPDGVVSLDEATVEERWELVAGVMDPDHLRDQPPTPTGDDPEVHPRGDS
ncbi:CapA family protein [Nesterenkonia sp. MY13]|uniref:CapA family protein n=1 Tax=Nesterenkonia sedimenti TaxID=1463632 RepID=A0A7X8TID0_9MICC|nr:CapA family protein [Nesterenkonia sedimenti]NLS09091.1 CapA family protein [Nesterenkonia sedimenti]